MAMPYGEHKQLMLEALGREAEGQRALLGGDEDAGCAAMLAAAALYRRSWELASSTSYGRLVGALKAAIIGADAGELAAYARTQIPDPPPSPPAAYVVAIAALVCGEDVTAAAASRLMRDGASDPFARAADAVLALARADADGYALAVRAIVSDFESRDAFVTGVPIADTALMFERLAQERGMRAGIESRMLPAG